MNFIFSIVGQGNDVVGILHELGLFLFEKAINHFEQWIFQVPDFHIHAFISPKTAHIEEEFCAVFQLHRSAHKRWHITATVDDGKILFTMQAFSSLANIAHVLNGLKYRRFFGVWQGVPIDVVLLANFFDSGFAFFEKMGFFGANQREAITQFRKPTNVGQHLTLTQGVCHAMEFVCLQDQFENAVR